MRSNQKVEENKPALELNFLSNTNCAGLDFEFENLDEPYSTPSFSLMQRTVKHCTVRLSYELICLLVDLTIKSWLIWQKKLVCSSAFNFMLFIHCEVCMCDAMHTCPTVCSSYCSLTWQGRDQEGKYAQRGPHPMRPEKKDSQILAP